jgi:hypothetical protein
MDLFRRSIRTLWTTKISGHGLDYPRRSAHLGERRLQSNLQRTLVKPFGAKAHFSHYLILRLMKMIG